MNKEGFLLEEEKSFHRFYRVSVWWVGHRALLRRFFYGCVITLESLAGVFVVWTMLAGFVFQADAEHDAVAQMVSSGQADLHRYTVDHAARALEPGSPRAFSLGDGKYDFYVSMVNANADWWAEFGYHFETNQGATDVQRGFILPQEEKPFVVLSFVLEDPPEGMEFIVDDISWHRVDTRLIPDYATWAQERLRLTVSDIVFAPQTAATDKPYARLSFHVENETAFSYYRPRFYLVLLRGSSVAGVGRTTLSALDSGEGADVVMNWFGTIPSITEVRIIPEIHLFDPGVYASLEGEPARDSRTRVFP